MMLVIFWPLLFEYVCVLILIYSMLKNSIVQERLEEVEEEEEEAEAKCHVLLFGDFSFHWFFIFNTYDHYHHRPRALLISEQYLWFMHHLNGWPAFTRWHLPQSRMIFKTESFKQLLVIFNRTRGVHWMANEKHLYFFLHVIQWMTTFTFWWWW